MSNKSKKEAVVNTRDDLEEHIAAFLKAGGKVQQIPSGVSGQTSTSGPRQIVLATKPVLDRPRTRRAGSHKAGRAKRSAFCLSV